jgi:hypothetical protein
VANRVADSLLRALSAALQVNNSMMQVQLLGGLPVLLVSLVHHLTMMCCRVAQDRID